MLCIVYYRYSLVYAGTVLVDYHAGRSYGTARQMDYPTVPGTSSITPRSYCTTYGVVYFAPQEKTTWYDKYIIGYQQ